MDAKALAKSKRAHSLHLNKKHNPHHASKGSSAVSGTSAGDKKATVKQVKEKPKPKLPSNWDRYEEENSDSETATPAGASNASDVVEPKSKGADYAYLLSEAKDQLQYSSEDVSFGDDILDGNAFIPELLAIWNCFLMLSFITCRNCITIVTGNLLIILLLENCCSLKLRLAINGF